MNNEKYEPIKFETWQELAKFVIDGGDVYYNYNKITFDAKNSKFNFVFTDHLMNNLCIKKQPILEELIAIKPRLCWVWDIEYDSKRLSMICSVNDSGKFIDDRSLRWYNAQTLTDDEIKQFLSDGDNK